MSQLTHAGYCTAKKQIHTYPYFHRI